MYPIKVISKKLKTFPHNEFSSDKYSNIDTVKKKISNLEDLFERGHKYRRIEVDDSYPEYIINNLSYFKDYILEQ